VFLLVTLSFPSTPPLSAKPKLPFFILQELFFKDIAKVLKDKQLINLCIVFFKYYY
jgi:hypothetical protein